MSNKRLKCIICCLLVLLVLSETIPVFAENEKSAVKEAQSIIDGIVIQKDSDFLTENAGVGAEWYVIALRQYDQRDFSDYETALLSYLQENQIYAASSRQKYALALLSVGSENQYIQDTVNDSIGQQGIMSWVFGLHLLNNGCVSQTHTLAQVKDTLLSLQLADGGWAVMGTTGDVDVTAMTIQALAPHYETDTKVANAIEKALTLLSDRQQVDGDYVSYGVSNAESTAQVLIALSSLGIDCTQDDRFIKNGRTLFDGLEKYRLAEGSFSHEAGGKNNEIATAQVLCAMVSYVRMKNGESGLYVFEQNPTEETTATPKPQPQPSNYKPWACLILVGVGGAVCLVLFFLKKRHIKNFIAVLLVVALGIGVVLVTDFQTADDYYDGDNAKKENIIGTVTLTIRCDVVAEDGIVLDTTEFPIAQGDTVFTILTEAARTYGIHMEYSGTEKMAYIKGIDHLYEFQHGDLSGWVYLVNDQSPSVGCGEYVLKDGDAISWLYTCNLGNDVKERG